MHGRSDNISVYIYRFEWYEYVYTPYTIADDGNGNGNMLRHVIVINTRFLFWANER